MTRDQFNRNARLVDAILNPDPFVSPKHEGTIFYDHSCPVCQDGKLPCKTKVVGNCGNLFARND